MRRLLVFLTACELSACASAPPAPTLIDGPSPVARPEPTPPIPLEDVSDGAPLLYISARGIDVWHQGAYVFPDTGCPSDGPTVCLVPESRRVADDPASAYDLERLEATMYMLKQLTPQSERLMIAADPDILYDVVVKVLDLTQPSFPNVVFVIVGGSE